MFNAHFNSFFDVREKGLVLDFAGDSFLSLFAESFRDFVKFLELESKVAPEWFSVTDMIVNPHKFQAMIIVKGKGTTQMKLWRSTIDCWSCRSCKPFGWYHWRQSKFQPTHNQYVSICSDTSVLYKNNFMGTKTLVLPKKLRTS